MLMDTTTFQNNKVIIHLTGFLVGSWLFCMQHFPCSISFEHASNHPPLPYRSIGVCTKSSNLKNKSSGLHFGGHPKKHLHDKFKAQVNAPYDVSWWQRSESEIDNDTYGRRWQIEFGLNRPNEKWSNYNRGLNGATPNKQWGVLEICVSLKAHVQGFGEVQICNH